MKKLLIAMPAYAGQMYVHTTVSLIQSIKVLEKNNIQCNFIAKSNESLIQRARNDYASKAVREKYDKIIFIDSDVGFKSDWILRLWNHNAPVVGGSYPMKKLPIEINLNLFPQDQHVLAKKPHTTLADLENIKKYLPTTSEGLVPVLHVPTGFLMIDVATLNKLLPKVPIYFTNKEKHADFFPTGVNSDHSSKPIFESEDWGFCRLCNENDIPVYFDPDLICDHTGTFTFR